MYNTTQIEKAGKPAVALVHRDFVPDAMMASAGKGIPGLRLVPELVPLECTIMADVEVAVDAVVDDIIAALTKPLTAEEKAPQAPAVEAVPSVVFKGSLAEVNRFYYQRGWTDGLPVIPPTPEAVAEMLAGTDLPPDHVVAEMIPRLGKATVEKIAVNAVMAGALPTAMPVLIAAVKALLDPRAYFGTWQVSTGSWAPFWVVNGPIRPQINLNCGVGALSPGDIANATIGRAIGLIIKNIGGVRKGIEDMGVLGNPGKYTQVIGEKEEDSPWEPLHVEHGLKKEDSAITLFCPNCDARLMTYGSDDKGILNAIIYNLLPGRRGLTLLALNPLNAKALADKGWTKDGIRFYVSQYGRVPAFRHSAYVYGADPGVHEKELVTVNPMDSMSILHDPDWIRVVVAGGSGNIVNIFQAQTLSGSVAGPTSWVTQKIDLPPDWEKLVRKYRNVVPTYLRY
ncbi:MAG: hypothetical protein ABID87_08940 [Chloroflexota bacterium]